jgi:hypothetical protein
MENPPLNEALLPEEKFSLRLLAGKIATWVYQEAIAAIIGAETVIVRAHDFVQRFGRIDHRPTNQVFDGVCHRSLRSTVWKPKKAVLYDCEPWRRPPLWDLRGWGRRRQRTRLRIRSAIAVP